MNQILSVPCDVQIILRQYVAALAGWTWSLPATFSLAPASCGSVNRSLRVFNLQVTTF